MAGRRAARTLRTFGSSARLPGALWAAAVLGALVLGLTLRLEDPLSTDVIAAEDPYTHMALVSEHLRDGSLDPLYEGADLYPPGFHAVLASVVAYSGIGLHDLFRVGPTVFGAMGILGAAWLLLPLGRAASGLGAFAYAVVPELVFRTAMMAPTAMDLAVLPFLLGSLVRLAKGGIGWAAPVALILALLVFAHPWLLALLFLVGLAFAAVEVALPTRTTLLGVLLCAGMIGVATGVAVTGCSGMCGPGLMRIDADTTQGQTTGNDVGLGLTMVAAGVLLPTVAFIPEARAWWREKGRSRWGPAAMSVTVLVGWMLVFRSALADGLPEHVDLGHMLGLPVAALAVAGAAAAPWLRSTTAHAGLAWAMGTFPLVVKNPLDSPFWPHRTAVYLALGAVVLAAVAAYVAWRLLQIAWSRSRHGRRSAHGAIAVAVAVLVGAVVVGATHEPQPWYRLYGACESEALRDIGTTYPPPATLVTAAWQSKLVVAAYAENATRVWYTEQAFAEDVVEDYRWIAREHSVYLVADPLAAGDPEGLGLPQVASYCGGRVYVHEVPPHP